MVIIKNQKRVKDIPRQKEQKQNKQKTLKQSIITNWALKERLKSLPSMEKTIHASKKI